MVTPPTTQSATATWPGAFADVLRRGLWFPLAVFILHVVIYQLGLYGLLPYLDVPMHALGGFAIAYFFSVCLDCVTHRGLVTRPDPLVRWVLLFALVGTAAVFWEFGEFVADRTIGTDSQLTVDDVLADLALGLAGGVVFLTIPAGRGR